MTGGGALTPGFFARPAPDVAADLIGCGIGFAGAGGIIVETEAYDRDDPASHSVKGPNRRNASMFGPPGRAYVYRSYGLHWCLNLVCETGSAVLIRTIEPRFGLLAMAERRRTSVARLLCTGPGRLCQALGVEGVHDGLPLDAAPFAIESADVPVPVVADRRIGISRAVETPWRFLAKGSAFVSRPARNGGSDVLRPLPS